MREPPTADVRGPRSGGAGGPARTGGRDRRSGASEVGAGGGERGQSSLVGSLVMAVIVALVLGAVGAQLFATFQVEESTVVDLEPRVNGSEVTLVHAGGDPLPLDRVRVTLDGEPGPTTRFTLDAATVEGDGDDRFEVGERASHPHGLGGGVVRVLVADDRTGALLLDERLSVPS